MMLRVCIKQTPNHPLILRIVFSCLGLKEFDAALAQSDSDFDPFVLKHKILPPRQEVSDDLRVSHRFVRVIDFCVHKFAYLSANSLHQIFESHLHDR